jgi:hypothetical protein
LARRKETAEARGKVVANAAEGSKPFLVGTDGCTGIPNAPMNALRAGKDGTLFRDGIADGDNRMKVLAFEFGNGFGAVRRNVDADFAHGFDRQRAHVAVGPATRAANFVSAAAEMPEQALGHLAANAIARAKDENSMVHNEVHIAINLVASLRLLSQESSA